MESVISLCFSALPSPSVRIMPSGFHAARAAKSHLIKLSCSFSVPKLETRSLSLCYNSSLSLSGNSVGRWPLDSIIGPVCCTADSSPSKQSTCDEKRQQEQQLRDMVHRLLQSQPLDLANRLKALEPIVKEYFSLSNKIIDIVEVLKDSENYNLALKLLKISEQIFIEKEDSLGTFRFKIMEILYSQGKYQEAFDYWIRLCEIKAPQTRRKLFIDIQDMKSMNIGGGGKGGGGGEGGGEGEGEGGPSNLPRGEGKGPPSLPPRGEGGGIPVGLHREEGEGPPLDAPNCDCGGGGGGETEVEVK